jgi:hypothetical protein
MGGPLHLDQGDRNVFKPSSLISWLIPCCATGSSDPGTIKALLDKNNVGILSAACCDSTAGQKDEGLKQNLLKAMELTGDTRPVIVETITSAQQHMRTLESQADADQKKLIQSVVALFQANGLSIFPLLIVNGRVAYYGGVPSVEMIQEQLQKQPLTTPSA